jgi:hypothetical protein
MKSKVPLLLCFLVLGASAQEPTRVLFHVISVRSADSTRESCPNENCSATKLTVEGHANSVEYILTCDEILLFNPEPSAGVRQRIICQHVHANAEYPAKVFAGYVIFQPVPHTSAPDLVGTYSIVSEKETRMQRKGE